MLKHLAPRCTVGGLGACQDARDWRNGDYAKQRDLQDAHCAGSEFGGGRTGSGRRVLYFGCRRVCPCHCGILLGLHGDPLFAEVGNKGVDIAGAPNGHARRQLDSGGVFANFHASPPGRAANAHALGDVGHDTQKAVVVWLWLAMVLRMLGCCHWFFRKLRYKKPKPSQGPCSKKQIARDTLKVPSRETFKAFWSWRFRRLNASHLVEPSPFVDYCLSTQPMLQVNCAYEIGVGRHLAATSLSVVLSVVVWGTISAP